MGLKTWMKTQRDIWEAREWLRANNSAQIAARCMFYLNHNVFNYYKRSPTRDRIYSLKNKLVRNLYESGYCVHASQQVQNLACRHCNDKGLSYWWYDDDYYDYDYHIRDENGHTCQWCGGTHVYKSHVLYRFIFNIDGNKYIWHQPEDFVDWKVELSDPEVGIYKEPKRDFPPLPANITQLYLRTVNLYLGSPFKDGKSFRQALKEETRYILADVKDKYYGLKLKWFWFKKRFSGKN